MARATLPQLGSLAILAVSTIGAGCLFWVLPVWAVPSVLLALNSLALALVALKRPLGYTIGQLGLFLFMLVAVINIVGDPEDQYPWPSFTAVSPYAALAVACICFLGFAIILRRARAQLQVGAHCSAA
jgi:hypothetical protein